MEAGAGTVDSSASLWLGCVRAPNGSPSKHGAVEIRVPKLSLLVLVGASGCGKSTFAARLFHSTEVVSSDHCRALVSDDEDNQIATRDAFDVLHLIVAKRLARGRLTVVDATNVQRSSRRPLLKAAERHYVPAVAVVFDLPKEVCVARAAGRPGRDIGPDVVRAHVTQLRAALAALAEEGFDRVYVVRTPEQMDAAEVVREPSATDRRWDHGPFDIVGDVHGCAEELTALLNRLGYEPDSDGAAAAHPEGRTAVVVGDLVDHGPDTPGVLRLVMNMVEAGAAVCVVGDHEDRLLRALCGQPAPPTHGLAASLEQLAAAPSPRELRARAAGFLRRLPSHYVLDGGRLVVAHAGLPREMHGRDGRGVREFALYGGTDGEIDEFAWAREYRARPLVVYGHTPVRKPQWLGRTLNVDTGCVFGGTLTALRYPEMELVSRRPPGPTTRPSARSVGRSKGCEDECEVRVYPAPPCMR